MKLLARQILVLWGVVSLVACSSGILTPIATVEELRKTPTPTLVTLPVIPTLTSEVVEPAITPDSSIEKK